jgi:hypothetical protein
MSVCTCWDAVRDTHCPMHGDHVVAAADGPLEKAAALRRRAAEHRAEASRLDRRAAFLTLDAHKARRT